ncbi:MAG TPA: hypothetical protein PKD27_00015 [Tepidiformaceae bacterium]|nr:hypothetical protein [Tepidiformaceae bacterium]
MRARGQDQQRCLARPGNLADQVDVIFVARVDREYDQVRIELADQPFGLAVVRAFGRRESVPRKRGQQFGRAVLARVRDKRYLAAVAVIESIRHSNNPQMSGSRSATRTDVQTLVIPWANPPGRPVSLTIFGRCCRPNRVFRR